MTIAKKSFKILIAILLFAALNITVVNSAEAASGSIWASPVKAKKIGLTFTVTTTVSREDANMLRRHLTAKDDGIATVSSGLAGLATAPFNTATGGLLSVGVTALTYILTSKIKTDGSELTQHLLDNPNKSFKFKMTYRYYQKGSNDGAYMLNKLEIIK